MHERKNASNAEQEKLAAEFVEHYMEKLFYFCLKKTGNSFEAEDLTQEISLQVLTALQGGTVPQHFSAWVWQIARNRYSVWADRKHKRVEHEMDCALDDCEIEDESERLMETVIHNENLSALRRELAFIRSDYRDIVVAYYIDGKSLREIAEGLLLPESTVKQRLYRARNLLKEGMEMAREFGVRSYKPEQIAFVMNGRDGKKGQPWSIITHLLYKNIFLETYENPETAEELALELGVALPYMEDELEFLVREQLLRKVGNKYQTDFQIVSRDEQRAVFDANQKIRKPLTDKICEMIDLYMAEDGAKVNADYIGYEAAKWALLVRAFDWLAWDFSEQNQGVREYSNTYPERPDQGAWVITGFETIDWKTPAFVGQHGYLVYDKNEVKQNIDYGQFKFFYQNHQEKTPQHLTWHEVYTLWLVCVGKAQECEASCVEKMIEYGYLKKNGSEIEPNVVVFDLDAEKPYNAVLTEKLTALRQEIHALFKQAPGIERGYVVEQALADGWLTYDENTINTIGAYIYL